MRKNGSYRFSLQFPAKTDDQIRVGELLEHMGNRKSAVIVVALTAFIDSHPELLTDKAILLSNAFPFSQKPSAEIPHPTITDQVSFPPRPSREAPITLGTSYMDRCVDSMLENLSAFQ